MLNNYKAEQHNVYGLIITNDLIWELVGLPQLRN
jgi:hypothetical protein